LLIYYGKKGGEEMRYLAILIVAIVAVAFVGSAMAVPPGKSIDFTGAAAQGKVTFDGKAHADKGLKCADCHTKIFPMKGPGKEGAAKMTMADMKAGKYCGACHNGTKAFGVTEASDCGKCHKK
jgi:c(7)-type cytochrome triheme protein